jgi:hypothetical protein
VVPRSSEGAPARGLEGSTVSRRPVVVKVQRSPVVYEPEAPVPDQQVRVAWGAVHVGHQGVKPNDARGKPGTWRLHERVEAEGAWKVVKRQVQTRTPLQEVLYLGVWFGSAQPGREMGEYDLRHQKAQAACDLTSHQLGHERLPPLPSPPKLEHVGPKIVSLDDRRQRAPLTQGRYVPRRSDRPEQAEFLDVDVTGSADTTYSTGS